MYIWTVTQTTRTLALQEQNGMQTSLKSLKLSFKPVLFSILQFYPQKMQIKTINTISFFLWNSSQTEAGSKQRREECKLCLLNLCLQPSRRHIQTWIINA